nr:exodeoxyribonuclease V subunit gamma [Smithellaceae bacterium]
MKIIVSNKLEILARRLADELKKPLGSALAKEIIIIQSAGMQKWLSLEIARRHGICANYDFPFPNAFIDNIFQAFIDDYRPDLSDHVDVMAWKVMEILPDMVADNDFRPVQNYLGRDFDQLKLFQLACKIAAAFDQYLIYRPEMILSWDEGRDILPQEKWQARLWRRLTADLGGMHRARLKQLFLSAVKHKPHRQDVLPQRISIFGISYLPPYHLEIFYELSRHLPVDLYYVNPSQEFWADIKSDREIGMAVKQATRGAADFDQQALHLERGNAL